MPDLPLYDDIKPVHAYYSDDAVRAIGEFFLATANAEQVLSFSLATLQCYPNKVTINAMLVLSGMQNKVLLEKLREAVTVLAPEHGREFDNLCGKIRRIFEHRNTLAHNSSLQGGENAIQVTIIKLGKANPRYHVKQIREFTSKLYRLVRHVTVRLKEIGIEPIKELTLPTPLEPGHPQPQVLSPTA